MRASAAAEAAGIPSVSIVVTGFLSLSEATAESEGMGDLAIAEYPGVILTDSPEELETKIKDVLLNRIIKGLTTHRKPSVQPVEPEPKEIIFRGSLEEVIEFFRMNSWTDGLPIIPPTVEKVEKFLQHTDRSPDEVVAILPPEKRQATIWNIAVNGVMAGCRAEYMPVLVAVVEAIAEPEFRLQDAGSTPGWEPLIVINGPVIKTLDFNCGSGVMRVGRQANTSVGRFLRLYMRNVAGLRTPPGKTDKACIGQSFNVALAENEDVVEEIGWKPFSVERGFKRGENVVTVQSVVYVTPPTYSSGHTARDHLETIADVIGCKSASYWTHNCVNWGKSYPIIVMSPSIARVLAKEGLSKDDIKRYLYENTMTPAGWSESHARQIGLTNFNYCNMVFSGKAPNQYCKSTDPERLVPVFLKPEWIGIVVSGDPDRNQSKGYVQNHEQGPPISKLIQLPCR